MVDLESMDLSKMVGGEQNAELVDQIRNYQTQLRLVNNELEDQKAALQVKRKSRMCREGAEEKTRGTSRGP